MHRSAAQAITRFQKSIFSSMDIFFTGYSPFFMSSVYIFQPLISGCGIITDRITSSSAVSGYSGILTIDGKGDRDQRERTL